MSDASPPPVAAEPPSPTVAAVPQTDAAAVKVPAGSPQWPWWAAGGALVLLLAGGIFHLLRRPSSGSDNRPEHAGSAEDDLLPASDAAEPPPSRPLALAPAPVIPRPSFALNPLDLALEPQRMTKAVVNALLAYRLSLTNRGEAALGPISIACDIISAHASLSTEEQFLLDAQKVEPMHQFLSLLPGESITITGELRLPLAEVLPIRSGSASLFVLLARFRIVAMEEDQPPFVSTRVFVIGESPDQPGDRLRPFRMDQGPRTFSRIGHREVTISA